MSQGNNAPGVGVGEWTKKPEPGLEPITSLLVSAVGPLEPLPTREL